MSQPARPGPAARRAPQPPAHRGHSLVELGIVLAIAGLTLSLAAPGLRDLVLSARMAAAVNELVHDLHLARNRAIHLGQAVTLCQSPDGAQCGTSRQWEGGWIVFTDPDEDRLLGPGETLLARRPARPGLDLRFSAFGSPRNVTYYPTGWTWNRNGTFTLCDARGPGAARAVILHRSGRVRTSHTKADGGPLTCP